MSEPARIQEKWINSLLEQLQLVRPKRAPINLRLLWSDLENCKVPDRIRAVVADINGYARYPVLTFLDYLAPQRYVLRVIYTRNKVEFVMAVVLLSSGPAVTFRSARVATARWERYLPGRTNSREHGVEIVLGFRAEDITEDMIRAWLSFLVSGFKREFESGLRNPVPRAAAAHGASIPRKASA